MGSTYLTLCNKVLQRLNEVELAENTFDDTRGIHSTVKTAVNDAVNTINSYKSPWYFNACEAQLILTPDQEEYSWNEDFVFADWNSFQIQKDDDLNVRSKNLKKISREEWYEYLRDADTDAEPDGIRMPTYVFEAHDFGFGISPSPNEEYTLKYRYYISPAELSAFDDETTIPTRFDYIIVTGAMWYLNMFKGDSDATQLVGTAFDKQLKSMFLQLTAQRDHFYDTRVEARRSPWEHFR